jgi:hypothetical protein
MALPNGSSPSGRILQFACDCVSHLHETIRDPWSYVSRARLISNETKEIILNKTYRQPKTVTQLAKEIGLSQPVIFKHVKELLASDMIREAPVADAEKSYRVEKYYEPSFPVLLQDDVAQLTAVCEQVAARVAEIYWEHRNDLEQAVAGTSLPSRGYALEDVLDFFYSKIRRLARKGLNDQGYFPELPEHPDGSRWVYWAEEISIDDARAEKPSSP